MRRLTTIAPWALALSLLARGAQGQAPKVARLQIARAEGAMECPDSGALGRAINERLGRSALSADGPLLTVEIVRNGDRFRAIVRSGSGERTLEDEGPSCAALAEALTLTLSLMLEPGLEPATAPSPAPPPSTAPAPSAPPGAGLLLWAGLGWALLRPLDAPPVAAASAEVELRTGGLLSFGLEGLWAASNERALEAVGVAGASARAGLRVVFGRGCVRVFGSSRGALLSGCGGAGAGAFSGQGEGLSPGRSGGLFWGALGAGLAASAPLSGPLFGWGSAWGWVPIEQARFTVDVAGQREVVLQGASLVPSLSLGLGLKIW